MLDKKSLSAWARSQRSQFESKLRELVEIESVSSDPDRKADVRRAAEAGAKLIRDFGGEARVVATDGHPIVFGRFRSGNGAPVVTLYNHLDVQPASRGTEPWETEPFKFTARGDRYFGRGTTDDKGPALSALWGIRAARDAGVPVNVNVI